MNDEEAKALADAAAKVQDLILKAVAATSDCIQAELNVNMLTKPDGTLADCQAAAMESRLNHAIFSHASPIAPLIRLGITVGEARRDGWRGIPDEPDNKLWIWCRGVKAVVDRSSNVAKTLCISINWELNEPQFLPF